MRSTITLNSLLIRLSLLSLLLLLLPPSLSSSPPSSSTGGATAGATAGATHAVIVSTSRYWFNYRHASNALSIYHLLKSRGVHDDNIVLMLADDMPNNVRNVETGKMYGERSR